MAPLLDAKPYVEHDDLLGHRYVAGTRCVLPRPGGGTYELAVNSAGIRSNREYARTLPDGVRRVLVLGDSFAAGQYVSNDQRFTELLERRVENLEVMNLALEGTGTDQQLLIYEQLGPVYEHDMVVIFPFLQNIRRNLVSARVAFDARTGQRVTRHKPRFELTAEGLVLRDTPVPLESPPGDDAADVDDSRVRLRRSKEWLNRLPFSQGAKKVLYAVKPWEPFPEYRRADTPGWKLMAVLLQRLHRRVSPRPLVIVPVFYDSYVRYRMARNYWDRFRSLVGPGVHVVDLLPHFRRLGRDASRCFQTPHDCHFSNHGHLVVADALLAECRELLSGSFR